MAYRSRTIATDVVRSEPADPILEEVLALRRDVQRAAGVLRHCRGMLRTLEAQLDQCEALLDQTLLAVERVRRTACPTPRRHDGVEPSDLSVRELEVLQLVARGLSNAAIAEHLNLAEGTVKNHMRSICRKLEVRGRFHAVVVARRAGLLV